MTHLAAVYPVEVWNADSGAFEPAGSALITRRYSRALTPHMRHIVTLWLVGHSDAEITALLGITRNTIRKTLHTVKERLGLYTRHELFLWAYAQGLIQEWAEGVGRDEREAKVA
jgi:DNA-binding CsgD family transcriptional regulator